MTVDHCLHLSLQLTQEATGTPGFPLQTRLGLQQLGSFANSTCLTVDAISWCDSWHDFLPSGTLNGAYDHGGRPL